VTLTLNLHAAANRPQRERNCALRPRLTPARVCVLVLLSSLACSGVLGTPGAPALSRNTATSNSPSWLKQAVTRYALGAPKGARTQRAFIIIISCHVGVTRSVHRPRLGWILSRAAGVYPGGQPMRSMHSASW